VLAHGVAVPPDWLGRQVFAFQPHATHFVAPVTEVVPIDLPASTAVLLPTMETATNLLLDGQPLLGERVVVLGQGVVGLLTTALLARFPLGDLVTVEPVALRREVSAVLGARASVTPEAASDAWWIDRFGQGRADLVYELSGHSAALNGALTAAGYAGRVIVGSWYGQAPVSLALGGRFHRSKITVQASQVSHLAPALTGRWSKQRRLSLAAAQLARVPVGQLISHTLPFHQAAAAFELLDCRPESALQVVLHYGDADA
jgi:alcohol dehydrogenase